MGARGSSGDSGGSRPQGVSEPLPAQKSLPCEAPVVVRTSPAKENYDTPGVGSTPKEMPRELGGQKEEAPGGGGRAVRGGPRSSARGHRHVQM